MPPIYPLMPTYCEPGNGSFFSEPSNALSSLAMIAGAFYALRVWKNQGSNDRTALLLIATLFLIGINSVLFHSGRSSWMLIADLVPILVFMAGVFSVLLTRLFAQSRLLVAVHLIGFLAASLMVTLMLTPKALGSGAYYIVPLLILYVLGAILILRARLAMHDERLLGSAVTASFSRHFPELKMGYALLQVGVLLALGLLARSYDLKLCAQFPFGLHMVWHVIVAVASTILVLAIIRYTRAPEPVGDLGSEAETA